MYLYNHLSKEIIVIVLKVRYLFNKIELNMAPVLHDFSFWVQPCATYQSTQYSRSLGKN